MFGCPIHDLQHRLVGPVSSGSFGRLSRWPEHVDQGSSSTVSRLAFDCPAKGRLLAGYSPYLAVLRAANIPMQSPSAHERHDERNRAHPVPIRPLGAPWSSSRPACGRVAFILVSYRYPDPSTTS